MARKHKPEEIIGKLREAEIVLAHGGLIADACRRIGVTGQTYYRWRREYGGLKTDQARRMPDPASSYAVREYLAVLDDAAFGGATPVPPMQLAVADPAARWTAASRERAFFAHPCQRRAVHTEVDLRISALSEKPVEAALQHSRSRLSLPCRMRMSML